MLFPACLDAVGSVGLSVSSSTFRTLGSAPWRTRENRGLVGPARRHPLAPRRLSQLVGGFEHCVFDLDIQEANSQRSYCKLWGLIDKAWLGAREKEDRGIRSLWGDQTGVKGLLQLGESLLLQVDRSESTLWPLKVKSV